MIDILLFVLPFLFLICAVLSNQLYLKLVEAAKELRVSRATVLGWIRSGRLRASDVSATPGIGKARWRISRADLDNFLADRQPKPEAKPSRRRRPTRPSGWVEYFK